jgi:hypothetical protein
MAMLRLKTSNVKKRNMVVEQNDHQQPNRNRSRRLESYASQSSIARSYISAVTSITFWLNNPTQQSPEDEDTTIWTEISENTLIRDSSALLLLTWSTSHVEPSSQSLSAWMSKVAQDVYEIFLRRDHHQWKRLSDLKKETHCSLHQLKRETLNMKQTTDGLFLITLSIEKRLSHRPLILRFNH